MDASVIFRGCERLLIVIAGMLSITLGYFLFIKGVSGKASLKAEYSKSKLQLANAAPGIFFSLFGASILIYAIRQSIKLDKTLPVESNRGATEYAKESGSPTPAPCLRTEELLMATPPARSETPNPKRP